MKLIKLAVIVIIVVLVLNFFGMLNPETSKKVDDAVSTTITKINNIEYKGNKLTEMSLKDISSNLTKDITYLKEEIETNEGVKLKGENLEVHITPTKDRVITAKLDASDTKAVESIEKIIKEFTGKSYKIPKEQKELGKINLYLQKTEDGYEVKFK